MHFQYGLRQASRVIHYTPGGVNHWLDRARRSRRRWSTRWLLPRKRRFLDGFIAGLEEYLANALPDEPAEPAGQRAKAA